METQRLKKLLESAVNEPGIIATAYTAFWNYSFLNCLWAYFQCKDRGIPLGPIATFKRWQSMGRHVKAGEKAIELCVPRTGHRTETNKKTGEEIDVNFVRFVWVNRFFVLAQTEGTEYTTPDVPNWDKDRALVALDIILKDFNHSDGNTLGFARDRTVHVSPLSPYPFKTLIHEIAHVILGHTDKTTLTDTDKLDRSTKEVEAEAVAFLCCHLLDCKENLAESRGYIQTWIKRTGQDTITEKTAQRIFGAVEKIIKAGRKKEPS